MLINVGMLRTRWAKSASANLAATLIVAVAGFLSVLVLARHVPIVMFGAIGFMVLIMNSIAAFDGLRPVIILRLAPGVVREPELFWTALIYSALVGALVGAASAFFVGASFDLPWIAALLLGLACFLHFLASAIASFLDAAGDTLYTGIARSAGWGAVYTLFMALAVAGAPLAVYMAMLVSFQFGLVAWYMRRFNRRPELERGAFVLNIERILAIAADSANVIGFNLAAFVLGVADRLAVNVMIGPRAYGLYSAAYDLAVRPTVLFRVIATVSLPEIVEHGPFALLEKWWRLLLLTYCVTAAVAAALAVWSEVLVVAILGEPFRENAPSFALLAATLPLFAMSYFGAVLCQATGKLALQRRVFTIAALAFLVLLPFLILTYGLVGAALSVLLARLVDPALIAAVLRAIDVRPPAFLCLAALALYGGTILFAVVSLPLLSVVAWLGLLLVTLNLWRAGLLSRFGEAADSVSNEL